MTKGREAMIERMSRRGFARTVLAAGAATVAGPLAASEAIDASGGAVNRRISGLKTHDWREYFQSVDNDAILCVVNDRVLHYWGGDGFYRIYPTSVALSDEMTRRGRTEVVAEAARAGSGGRRRACSSATRRCRRMSGRGRTIRSGCGR